MCDGVNIFLCVQEGNSDELRRMLQQGASPYEALHGVLPMYAAICYDKPACAMVLMECMEPDDIISSDKMTCLATCVRFHRPHLYKYFLQFEKLSTLRDLYFNGEFIYDDIILECAREKVRRLKVLHMLPQFDQVLNSDVATCLAEYV